MKTCRILVNTPSSQGGIGDLYNFKLAPSLTLGCGSWGGNSVSENVGCKHLINIKTVAERRENFALGHGSELGAGEADHLAAESEHGGFKAQTRTGAGLIK